MLEALRERLRLLRAATDRPWVRVAAAVWLFICTYDTVGSQLLPKAVRERVPSVYEVIDMTSGFLPFWAWGLMAMAIVVVAAIEYAAKKEGAKPWWGVRDQSPIRISLFQVYSDPGTSPAEESPWYNALTVQNVGSAETIDDVEVHIVRVTSMKPACGGFRELNAALIERVSKAPKFSLSPGMARDVIFFRQLNMGVEKSAPRIAFGPIERAKGEKLRYGPGLYKVDIAVYGRDVQPTTEALVVGVDEYGSMMYGRWTEDANWPFRIETSVEILSPQPPQGIEEKAPPKSLRG